MTNENQALKLLMDLLKLDGVSGEEKDVARLNPLIEQVGHPVGQCPGFAASCARDNQKASLIEINRFELSGIQHFFVGYGGHGIAAACFRSPGHGYLWASHCILGCKVARAVGAHQFGLNFSHTDEPKSSHNAEYVDFSECCAILP